MQLNPNICPKCGKPTSWQWANPAANVTATMPTSYQLPSVPDPTTGAYPLTTFQPYPSAAATAGGNVTNIDLCWCGVSTR